MEIIKMAYLEGQDHGPSSNVSDKDDDDFRMYRKEIVALVGEKNALERTLKSALEEKNALERTLKKALERASIVEEVQNQNIELKRQIEICQDESKILHKTNRQKHVPEVDQELDQVVRELEEAILTCETAADIAIRDYQRQISELDDEKRTLEKELAIAKLQWFEERRFMQAEIQGLKDKLTISERAATVEAHIKDKFMLSRLKTLDEDSKHLSSFSSTPNASCGSQRKSNQAYVKNPRQRWII